MGLSENLREIVAEKKAGTGSPHALHVSGLGVLGILGGCAQLGDTYCYFLAQRYKQILHTINDNIIRYNTNYMRIYESDKGTPTR